MRILFCCEFYAPSKGGVQEVMRQVAERLVLRGHDVTVATSKLASRDFDELNGVKVREFAVSGNLVRGMDGELDEYRHFITSHEYDVVMVKAAQQWTFDAMWPVLTRIRGGKVFIPCGFSGFHVPVYADYFRQLPDILRLFDHLIFYASDYRDINFAKEHGITNYTMIPNGASEVEFSATPDPDFRRRHGIGEEDFLFLTVGNLTETKGHLEVVRAFSRMEHAGPATLILNGNMPAYLLDGGVSMGVTSMGVTLNVIRKIMNLARTGKFVLKATWEGTLIAKTKKTVTDFLKHEKTFADIAEDINRQGGGKRVLITDLSRPELVQAFMSADLFVFASRIEYSPLVLFETVAAGTPFLSVPVGNAEEIAEWTGGGEICPASMDEEGYTRVDSGVLAGHMARLARDREHLRTLGARGKKNWAERFTWDKITREYEKVFESVLNRH